MDTLIKLLAFSQYMCLHQMTEDIYAQYPNGMPGIRKLNFYQYDRFHRILYEKLGFDYDTHDFMPKMHLLKDKSILKFTIENSVHNDRIVEKVSENYGKELSLLYSYVVYIANINLITSCVKPMLEYTKDKKLPSDENARFRKLEKECYKYFNELSWVMGEASLFASYFRTEFIEKMITISKHIEGKKVDLALLDSVHDMLDITDMVPEYMDMASNVNFANELIDELHTIKSGKLHWGKYEKFCIKVLKYLFIPEFKKVYVQARNQNGYERRDAIMPNNSESRFWKNIKSEFNANNIVFEFKNLQVVSSKLELNQLRIYLSKPTIGKFGFLFLRNKVNSPSLLQAQRDAYEQSKIHIVIIDDELLEKLILSKVYLNSCEDVIENEKVRFEINY